MTRMNTEQVLQIALQHFQSGRFGDAEQLYRAILAHDPRQPDALHMLGGLAYQANFNKEAAGLIQQALAFRPNWPEAWSNLGNALKRLGQRTEAHVAYQKALECHPGFAQAFLNLGNLALEDKAYTEAISFYQQAIRHEPRSMEAWNNLGNALKSGGNLEEAARAYERALAAAPRQPVILVNLGSVLQDQGKLEEARTRYEEAVAIDANYAEGHQNLGNVLIELGRLQEALFAYARALALKPGLPAAHSNVLLAQHHDPTYTPEAIAAELRRWGQIHADPLAPRAPLEIKDRSPDRRLRIGYISADFCDRANAWFLRPLLAHHDHERFEIFCYAENPRKDVMTNAFVTAADHWLDSSELTDEALAQRIEQDRIDILVDLMGHAGKHRLLVFARRPAPVQVTYLGFPNSTGLRAMDYRLTDALADPPGPADDWHTEKLVRLPGCFLCYQAPEGAPPVEPLPALQRGGLTLGSFNNVTRVSAFTVALWSEILKRLPNSRLLLKSSHLSMGIGEISEVQRRLVALFGENGVGSERLELQGRIDSMEKHLALYHRVDLALDTYPYHGTTTTCEALWMGVPVVTLAGRSHVSRAGVSLLTSVGLPELVAQSAEEYVGKAVELGRDLDTLAALRMRIRPQMAAGVLMDGAGFARKMEEAYRMMWRARCAQS